MVLEMISKNGLHPERSTFCEKSALNTLRLRKDLVHTSKWTSISHSWWGRGNITDLLCQGNCYKCTHSCLQSSQTVKTKQCPATGSRNKKDGRKDPLFERADGQGKGGERVGSYLYYLYSIFCRLRFGLGDSPMIGGSVYNIPVCIIVLQVTHLCQWEWHIEILWVLSPVLLFFLRRGGGIKWVSGRTGPLTKNSQQVPKKKIPKTDKVWHALRSHMTHQTRSPGQLRPILVSEAATVCWHFTVLWIILPAKSKKNQVTDRWTFE